MTIKTYFVKSTGELLIKKQHCYKRPLCSFREWGIFPQNLNLRKALGMKPFSRVWKCTICTKGVFSLVTFLATLMTNWAKMFPLFCHFMHSVGIHQVRILVFDNYQKCTLPLKHKYQFVKPSKRSLCPFFLHFLLCAQIFPTVLPEFERQSSFNVHAT